MDCIINPVLMGGLVKETVGDMVKIHLFGRLGVLWVPRTLIVSDVEVDTGHELEFYFSYIQVVEKPLDYDSATMDPELELEPCLLGGKIVEVNDTAIKVEMMNEFGTVAVPRRWVFTPLVLEEGQDVEFYFSCLRVKGKRDLPYSFI